VSVLVSLLGGEAFLRLTDLGAKKNLREILDQTRAIQEGVEKHGPKPIFKIWSIDESLGWRLKAGLYYSLRFVGYYESRYARTNEVSMLDFPPDRSRQFVFILGDSFIEALSVPLEQHFCRQLETIFPQYDFLNFGVSGFGSVQSYVHLMRRLEQFEAAYVIFGIYLGNDFDENDPLLNNSMIGLPGYRRDLIPFLSSDNSIVYGEEAFDSTRRWTSRSQLLATVKQVFTDLGVQAPYGFSVTLRVMALIRDQLRTLGIPFSALLIPDDDMIHSTGNRLYEELRESLDGMGIHTISLMEPFRATGRKTMGYASQDGAVLDSHWNVQTHHLVGRFISQQLPLLRVGG
jgi:hypothetical protein